MYYKMFMTKRKGKFSVHILYRLTILNGLPTIVIYVVPNDYSLYFQVATTNNLQNDRKKIKSNITF